MQSIYDSDLPLSSPKQINNTSIFIRNHPILSSMSMGGNNGRTRQEPSPATISVAQALEIARDSPDGAQDPTITIILESALSEIWGKIQARPTSYVMTRDEFAVFNYFQDRFDGNNLATSARKRYWDYLQVSNEGSY
jgi:hypothetical protein